MVRVGRTCWSYMLVVVVVHGGGMCWWWWYVVAVVDGGSSKGGDFNSKNLYFFGTPNFRGIPLNLGVYP